MDGLDTGRLENSVVMFTDVAGSTALRAASRSSQYE
jgi:hypothetical protein